MVLDPPRAIALSPLLKCRIARGYPVRREGRPTIPIALHVPAGIGALALGLAVLVREPRRPHSRLFALLCLALAVWNLGAIGEWAGGASSLPWRLLYLVGSCAAAPLGLHFILLLVGVDRQRRRVPLALAYAAAALVYATAWRAPAWLPWNLLAIAVLGAILFAAIVVLARHAVSLPSGPERSASLLLLVGAIAAFAGGMSDFVPRDPATTLRLGPLSVLLFLLLIAAAVVRHRFLDIDELVARGVALIVAAAIGALVLVPVVRLAGPRFLPIFGVLVLVLALVAPARHLLQSGVRTLIGGDGAAARAVIETSRTLSLAQDAEEVSRALERTRQALPGAERLAIHLERGRGEPFRLVGGAARGAALARDAALPRLLALEGAPLTRRLVERESQDGPPAARELASAALADLDRIGAELVVPLWRGDSLVGWLALGGPGLAHHVTGEVAAALVALGQQAVASLDRVEAIEASKRSEALAAVGTLAAGLAHEVRNPAAAIRGAAQVLATETRQDRAQEMLRVIDQESARLGRVVGEFLDYARPGSPGREPVDIGTLVERVAQAARAASPDFRIDVRAANGAVPQACADADQIERAFTNLVANAREAAGPTGRLSIELSAGAGLVAVRFTDDGPGIPDDLAPHVFRPFVSTKRAGTGLGLALAHRVIEAHGGSIELEGRPGRGAAFTVVLRTEDLS